MIMPLIASLKNFKSPKTEILGIEPSKNVATVAMKKKINTINKFFSFKTASSLKNFRNKTDLICAANAICHIPNLNDLIKGSGLFGIILVFV